MNNTAAAAIVPANHAEWIAIMNDSVSEFAKTMIRDAVLAEAKTGDYLAREYVAHEAQYFIRLEALSNEALAAELVESQAQHDAIRDEDGCEYDVDDYEEYYHRTHMIHSLLEHRAAIARYTAAQAGMVYNPFMELLKFHGMAS